MSIVDNDETALLCLAVYCTETLPSGGYAVTVCYPVRAELLHLLCYNAVTVLLACLQAVDIHVVALCVGIYQPCLALCKAAWTLPTVGIDLNPCERWRRCGEEQRCLLLGHVLQVRAVLYPEPVGKGNGIAHQCNNCQYYASHGIVCYAKKIYASITAAMIPARSASSPQVTAWRVFFIPTLPKYTASM